MYQLNMLFVAEITGCYFEGHWGLYMNFLHSETLEPNLIYIGLNQSEVVRLSEDYRGACGLFKINTFNIDVYKS